MPEAQWLHLSKGKRRESELMSPLGLLWFSVLSLSYAYLQGIRQVVQGIIRCRSWVPHVWWSAIFFPFQIEHISYSLLLSFILDCCLKLLGFTCTQTSKIDNQILKFPFCLALAHSIFSLPKHFFCLPVFWRRDIPYFWHFKKTFWGWIDG